MEPFLITPAGPERDAGIERAVVVFPDPVSPTSPNVFPCSNLDIDAVYRLYNAVIGLIMDHKILNIKN